jgi:thioredoxin-related protein
MSMLPWKTTASTLPVFLALLGGSARAQQIPWVTDYDQARDIALRWDRPLFLCIGCRDCVGCKKLDVATWPDPVISAWVRREFVAFRLEAEANPALVQAIRIDSFPTVVFAAQDGKILHAVKGHVDPTEMGQNIQLALNLLRDYREQQSRQAFAPSPAPVTSNRGRTGWGGVAAGSSVSIAPSYWNSSQQPQPATGPSPYYPQYNWYDATIFSPAYTPHTSC